MAHEQDLSIKAASARKKTILVAEDDKEIGAMRIYAGTTPEQARECLQVIVNELHKLEQEGITADELERAKVQLKSEHIMRSEGSGARNSEECA